MKRHWRQIARGLAMGLRQGPATTAQPFVMLFVPRTGSNLLAGMLDTHPDVLCHHELFLPASSPHRSLSVRDGTLDLDLGTAEERDRDPFAFVSKVYALTAGAKAVGFKMALSDPNVGILLGLILNRRIRKVVVRRDNWLQVYTSALIAEETRSLIEFKGDGSTNGREPAARRPAVRVPVEVPRFIRYVRKRRLTYGALRWIARLTGQRFFDMEYREIKQPARMMALLGFLGVSPELELHERTVKQNPSRLEDRIANYDDVRRRLTGTSYEVYLDG